MSVSIIIRICLIHFGILFHNIGCIHLGLISPIEVVEEFGCHDTEIRLTCGNLDSKLAILEASFTPNCTHDECLHLDMKRLVRTFASEETEGSTNAEKEAGQKFLETLRQRHSNEEDIDIDILDESESVDRTTNDTTNEQKKKRTSLRLVLERLIIRYLRHISPEEELESEHYLRSRRHIPTERNDIHSALNNDTIEDLTSSEEEDSIRIQSARPHCEEQRRQISSLNKIDLENSYRNQSDNEYNIRKVLNKRCSGKNHCSFIFAIDHPFAKVWRGGVVRIKYICMDDFRINRYCGEHLIIGNEIDPNIQILDTFKGEPVAEPRIQIRETSLHSLKIIKTDKSIASDSIKHLNVTVQEPRKIKNSKHREDVSEGHKTSVYSQDFRILKILPSNIDDFNDVETKASEIYFRKEGTSTEQSNVNEQNLSTSNYESTTVNEKQANVLHENDTEINKNSDNDSTVFENVTLTIREGGHYVMVYPSPNGTSKDVPNNLAVNNRKYETEPETTVKSVFQEFTSTTAQTQNPSSFTTDYITIEPESKEKTQDGIIDDEHLIKLHTSRSTYSSIQKTSFRSPLLHGFAMTPGYPKFYIGDFDCHWNILAPEGIRVRISIIDNSLRYDDNCKDFLQIVDFGYNRTLFNSCTDALQLVGIISTSNWIRVTVKTTSKFAYPKRGVLLHYTADGCVNPPLPTNVKLIDRTPTTAFYECQPSFLFPDSGLSTRKLTCNNIHVWDKLLPNCVEQEILSRSAVPPEEKLTLLSKKPDLSIVTNKMPSQTDADMIFDIIIPSILIAGLFIINGAVFAVIMKYRKRSKALEERGMELAEL